jgi:hypothetical protein
MAEGTGGTENAAERELEMREHERKAREHESAERSPRDRVNDPAGTRGDDDDAAENAAPPGNIQPGTITGS